MGRFKPGVTVAQAAVNLDQIAQQLARTYPDEFDRRTEFHLSRPGLIGQALMKALGVASPDVMLAEALA